MPAPVASYETTGKYISIPVISNDAIFRKISISNLRVLFNRIPCKGAGLYVGGSPQGGL